MLPDVLTARPYAVRRSPRWGWPNPTWPARPFPAWWPLEVVQAMAVFSQAEQRQLFFRFDGRGLGFYRHDDRYTADPVKVVVLAFLEDAMSRELAGLAPFPPRLRLTAGTLIPGTI